MAAEPHRRENLLRDATAFSRRLSLRLPRPQQWRDSIGINPIASEWCRDFAESHDWELFYGAHKQGGYTVHFGQQPVLQANSLNQLRRLYAGGQRFAAANGHLQLLQRDQLGGRVQFQPTQLSASDERMVIESCRWFAATAADLIDRGNFALIGQHPAGDDALIAVVHTCMARLAHEVTIAASPQQS